MQDTLHALNSFIFLFVLIFGTHALRSWAFSRYEAVTFECSSAALTIAVLMMIRCGASRHLVMITLALLVSFIANAFSQWHFYMRLQEVIEKAFSGRSSCLRDDKQKHSIDEKLRTMASVAVMPSFSRFIEESKLFNNPGSFIGLIKSIMKRQRFQKKKYVMRECFAENVNLIGPCRPCIKLSVQPDGEKGAEGPASLLVPTAVHANDLALDYPDEKKGLFSFDVLGFGGFALIWYAMNVIPSGSSFPAPPAGRALLTAAAVAATALLTSLLRHLAFARYESYSYELSFSALLAAAFSVFTGLNGGEANTAEGYVCLAVAAAAFLLSSFVNHSADRALHRHIGGVFDCLIGKLSLETETQRAKRTFLSNLKTISEWTVVPFPDAGKLSGMASALMFTPSLKEFDRKNRQKRNMPSLTEALVDEVVPEFSGEVTEADFRLGKGRIVITGILMWVFGIAGALASIYAFL